ncbi:MAG TPA: hypothetical protein VG322_08920 [Candidatus Acidoferrales bacterium]|jgi:hypothetical protein|nr:hypothetical protein [Candidatus Acidoferrales bacterium]
MITAIERRSSPRNQVLAPVQVLPAESSRGAIEIVGGLSNFSLNSLYFFMERYTLRKRSQLVVRLANQLEVSSLSREFMVEVVREEPLQCGRLGVAARLLHNIQLKLRDGLLLPETGIWSQFPLISPVSLNVYA